MKDLFVKFSVLLLSSIGLVGCETNTRQENTAIGVVSGVATQGGAGSLVGSGTGQSAAIGAGAVASALISGAIGNSMDSSDDAQAMHVMDDNPPNQPYYWKNQKTGNKYKVVATSGRVSYQGYSDCRRYHSVAMINGKKETVNGVACRMKNGKWESV